MAVDVDEYFETLKKAFDRYSQAYLKLNRLMKIDDRNLTSHTCREDVAEELFVKFNVYLKHLTRLPYQSVLSISFFL